MTADQVFVACRQADAQLAADPPMPAVAAERSTRDNVLIRLRRRTVGKRHYWI